MVLDGAPHGSVSLEGERHCQVDGDAEDDLVKLVKEAAERVLVNLAELVAVLPEIRRTQFLGLFNRFFCNFVPKYCFGYDDVILWPLIAKTCLEKKHDNLEFLQK